MKYLRIMKKLVNTQRYPAIGALPEIIIPRGERMIELSPEAEARLLAEGMFRTELQRGHFKIISVSERAELYKNAAK